MLALYGQCSDHLCFLWRGNGKCVTGFILCAKKNRVAQQFSSSKHSPALMLASVPVCQWRLRHNNSKVFRVPMEVSSTGEIHLRRFTAGEMQNLLTRLGERRAEEAAESCVGVQFPVGLQQLLVATVENCKLLQSSAACHRLISEHKNTAFIFLGFFNSQSCP